MDNSQLCFFSIITSLWRNLTIKEKLQAIPLILCALIPAFFELALAGVIALVAAAFVSTGKLSNTGAFQWVIGLTGWNWLAEQKYLCMSLLVLLLIMVLLKNAGVLLYSYVSARFSENISKAIACKMLSFFVRAPWAWHLTQATADLQFSIGASFQNGQALLQLQMLFGYIITALALMTGVFWADAWVAGGLLIIGGFSSAFAMWFCRRRSEQLAKIVFDNEKTANQCVYFAMHGIRELKMSGKEDDVLASYDRTRIANMKDRAAVAINSQLPPALMESVSFVLLPLIMYYLLEIQQFSMERTVAIMGLLAGAAWRMLPTLNRAMGCLMTARALMPYLNNNVCRLNEATEVMKSYVEPDDEAELAFAEKISIEHLSYNYPNGNSGLEDLSFEISKGQMLGVVGLSGAGKTTLVNVLTQLLATKDGMIKIDNTILTQELRSVWRRKIGYVQQAPFIFNGTLAENIALTDWGKNIDVAKANRCCVLAQLDFVDSLEHGLNTEIGDRGMRLSGGQAQRVAIARALYADPEILIFDEATSSLDQKNENAIHETIKSLRKNMTLIMIAHRLDTVQECDWLIWLDHGKLYKQGKAGSILAEYQVALTSATPLI